MIILRVVALLLAWVGVYVLLAEKPTGWVGECHLVIGVLLGWFGFMCLVERASASRYHWVRVKVRPWDRFFRVFAWLGMVGGIWWFLGWLPSALEQTSLRIESMYRPEMTAARVVSQANHDQRLGAWFNESSQRSLPQRTNLKFGKKPEVFIQIESSQDVAFLMRQKVYVRAVVYGQYTQGTWGPISVQRMKIEGPELGWTRFKKMELGRAIPHRVFHSYDRHRENVVIALQGATDVGYPSLQRVAEDIHLLPAPGKFDSYQYMAVSRPMSIESLDDHAVIRPTANLDEVWLALPEQQAYCSRLKKLARAAAGAGSMKLQLLQLQSYLQQHYRYSLVTQNLKNLDPIENFLFEEKCGHCEYYATACALMARAIGVPSRVAYGWAGGKWYESGGMFVFRGEDAHAWTEVCLDGYGWVSMEPTAPSQSGNVQSGDALDLAKKESFHEVSHVENGQANPWAEGVMGNVYVWCGLIVGMIGLKFILRRSQSQSLISSVLLREVMHGGEGYWRDWQTACAKLGRQQPASYTLKRQLSLFMDKPEFGDDLIAYHYARRYEGGARDVRFEKRLSKRIQRWVIECLKAK